MVRPLRRERTQIPRSTNFTLGPRWNGRVKKRNQMAEAGFGVRADVLPRSESSSRGTALQSRPDGSGEPSHGIYFLAGGIALNLLPVVLVVADALAVNRTG